MRINRIPYGEPGKTAEPEEILFSGFCDRHNLTIDVVDRGPHRGNVIPRYYAAIKNGETLDKGILTSTMGNGDTELLAIAVLKEDLLGKLLVVNAMTSDRTEIQCPSNWLYEPLNFYSQLIR